MAQVIHGVNNASKNFFLSNYSLTYQLIIINLFTAILGMIFLIIFNYFVISNHKKVDLKIIENISQISKIANYLTETAIVRVQLFNEQCENNTNQNFENNAECEQLILSEPLLDPSITQKYLIQNYLDKDFTILIYDNLKRLFLDTSKIYESKEVIEIDLVNKSKNYDFFNEYKNFYLKRYQDIEDFFVKKNYKDSLKKFYGDTSIVVETSERKSLTSTLHISKDNNLIQKLSIPIIKNESLFGVVLITDILNHKNTQKGINSFNLINLYFIIIIIMFLSSLFFSRSIVRPIKLLSKITQMERDKSKRDILYQYPIRGDEIGILGDDIKNMSDDLKKRVSEIESFAADVSHELKNPLSGLKSSSELLMSGKIDQEKQNLLLSNIDNDIKRMNILISDISNYTLTQAEISREILEETNIVFIIQEFLMSLIEKNDLIDFNCIEKEILININKNKFIQVLHNLFDNAFSYSVDKNRILISLKILNGSCYIYIADQGPGISLDFKEKIFERFYTDRISENRHTGLGLSISRNIIESFDGEIKLITNPFKTHQGACFEIKLPLIR